MKKISVIIPCYNEEKIIYNTYKELIRELQKLDGPYEIIFCNDGSTDNTLHILKKIQKEDDKVNIISYFPNRGIGFAYKELYKNVSGDIVIQMDADLAMKPADTIPIFLQEINDVDIVFGSRYAGIKAEYPLRRLIPSKVNLLLNNLLFNCKLRDITSGFFAFKKNTLDRISFFSNRFEIHTELFVKAKKNNFKIKEVPIKFIHRTESRDLSVLKYGPKVFVNILKLWVKIKRGQSY